MTESRARRASKQQYLRVCRQRLRLLPGLLTLIVTANAYQAGASVVVRPAGQHINSEPDAAVNGHYFR
jgi:hypothetical protein